MDRDMTATANKVAEVTLLFWVIKILATTLGETGGDALSMTMNLGYAVSTIIFGIRSSRRSPLKSRRAISIRSCIGP